MKTIQSNKRNYLIAPDILLKRLNLISLCVILSVFSFSCKKFVEVPPPKNLLVNSNVFNSDASATSAISGIYSNMELSGFANGGIRSVTNLAGLSADEFINFSTDQYFVQFYQNGVNSTNAYVTSDLWASCYQSIYSANEMIKGLNNSSAISTSLKQQLLGEAKFIRAFCNFYLVNLFGDIPLAITDDYKVNAVAKRTPKSQVYDQIVSDLKDAQNLLAVDYSFSQGEKVRPNKWVATALLARVYLYRGDYTNAELQSTTVINNTNLFKLTNDLNQVFKENSDEAIWQLATIGSTRAGGFFGIPTNGSTPYVTLSYQLLNAFENGDNRKTSWTNNIMINGVSYNYAYKYKLVNTSTTDEYSMVLRLAEQYLIRAEAEANGEGNGINGAIADLNIIRNRAGLGNTTANDKNSLLSAISHERQVELFTEWGDRWLNLKRTGQIDAVMGIVTPLKGGTWNTNYQLYPIPEQQILNDPNMTDSQNPGY